MGVTDTCDSFACHGFHLMDKGHSLGDRQNSAFEYFLEKSSLGLILDLSTPTEGGWCSHLQAGNYYFKETKISGFLWPAGKLVPVDLPLMRGSEM